MRALILSTVLVVVLSGVAFGAEPVVSVDLHGGMIGVAVHPFAAVAALKAELAKTREVYVEEAVDISGRMIPGERYAANMDLYAVQDINFAPSSATITQKLTKVQAVMAVAKEHPVVTTGVVGGLGTAGYFIGKALFGDDGGGSDGESATTDNRSTSTESLSTTDRHDTRFDINAGDNSPVTVIYQSPTTAP